MSKKLPLKRLLEFQRLLLEFSQIDRVVHRKHHADMVLETDTEHSYNLAMTAWLLADSFPELNRDLLIRFALVHDLVEIHAGDTYVFADPSHLATKHEREAKALEQLRKDWADFPDMIAHIEMHEKRDSPEAAFIYALDKIMPMMQIYINDGYTWQQENLTLQRLAEAKKTKVAASPAVLEYYEELYKLLKKRPDLIT